MYFLFLTTMFQHSAARRRLQEVHISIDMAKVSTLSRAEAAAKKKTAYLKEIKFQHSAARRRLLPT